MFSLVFNLVFEHFEFGKLVKNDKTYVTRRELAYTEHAENRYSSIRTIMKCVEGCVHLPITKWRPMNIRLFGMANHCVI